MKPIVFFSIACLGWINSYCQGELSFGIRSALGVTPFQNNSKLVSGNTLYNVRSQLTASRGVAIRYLVGRAFGLETGFQVTDYSYGTYGNQISTSKVNNFLGLDNNFKMFDMQVPLLLVLKQDHPTNPYKHFIFIAGTTVDWTSSDFLNNWQSTPWLKNIVFGVRVGSYNNSIGKFEYGFEYQYSQPFTFHSNDYSQEYKILSTRINVLSFTLYYFFYPTMHHQTDIDKSSDSF